MHLTFKGIILFKSSILNISLSFENTSTIIIINQIVFFNSNIIDAFLIKLSNSTNKSVPSLVRYRKYMPLNTSTNVSHMKIPNKSVLME